MDTDTRTGRRLISPKRAGEKASLSTREIRRRPNFPRPVKLGSGPNGRIAYVEDEIDEWVAEQISRRDRELGLAEPQPAPAVADEPADPPVVRRGRGRPKGSRNKVGHRAGRRQTVDQEAPPMAAATK